MLLFTANTIVTLLLASVLFWIYLTLSYRQTLVQEVSTISEILAESSFPALVFSDRKAATESLAVLRADSRVNSACLYDKRGYVFASYLRVIRPTSCSPLKMTGSYHFSMKELTMLRPVTSGNDMVGNLMVCVSLGRMYDQVRQFGIIGMFVLFAASLVAVPISYRLQQVISDPIIHLTQIAKRVSKGGNYFIRAAPGSEDETGVLIGQFNSMMEQISLRDLELKRAQDQLEGRVAERTRELEKEIAEREVVQHDLLNAKLLAEESNRAKSAFLANMSHELRTPLNAILGYSEMLEEDAQATGDSSEVDDLRRIQSAGRHLLALINDVLDLSKIEAGRVDLSSEPVQVSALMNDIISTIEPLARKNRNVFLATTKNPEAMIHVDVTKFRQCLLNLLSNACKFTEGGMVRLKVEYRSCDNRKWICWEVSDTGIGIAEGDRQKLFQAFSQVDSSATRRHGGTGLGLAISQRLTRMMGGWIEVETALGKGSTFTIFLPALVDGAFATGLSTTRAA
jgi:signal transduction histidine kinase